MTDRYLADHVVNHLRRSSQRYRLKGEAKNVSRIRTDWWNTMERDDAEDVVRDVLAALERLGYVVVPGDVPPQVP